MTYHEAIIYDSAVIKTSDVMEAIKEKANGSEVTFNDIEMTVDHYWLKFRSMEGWSKSVRHCYGEWEK